ncbi:MAG: SpoIIE family protein phosphatase [Gammaproteobacteria bacterium]|nr:SpoIIE family protein phosphatase [Gammaproteobacteria bacterium]
MGAERGEVSVLEPESGAFRQLTSPLLEGGFEVALHTASDELLTLIRKASPDVVFIPVSDDTITSGNLIADIKAKSGELPIILVADEMSVAQLTPLLQAGATSYLLLPHIDASLVVYTVQSALEHRREIRRHKRSERELKRLNKALVESAGALERDQRAGFRVQQGMMPESPYSTDDLTLRHLIVPSLILSGDFIDYFELYDGRLIAYIADVSGHGAQGAIVTVLLKSLSARLANEFEELDVDGAGSILEWFNRELIACGLEQHVTMFLGVIDRHGRRLHYANAAHFPATILRTDKSTEYLEMGGLPLGLYDGARYPERETELPDEYTMVMFSDGVFEILPEQSLKAKEDHLISLVKGDNGDIDSMADHLGLGAVKDVPDDITLFTVARVG